MQSATCSIVLLITWIAVTYLLVSPLRWIGNSIEVLELQERLKRASSQLETLQKRHNELIDKHRKSSNLEGHNLSMWRGLPRKYDHGPTEEYENMRRRLYSNTKELWYYLNHETREASKNLNPERIQAILAEVAHRKRSLLSDQEKFLELDGHQEWRRNEAAKVTDLVQRRLYHLQNPPDCREAKKVICNLNENCSFSCQLHHVAYCLIFAYATERTLILNSKGWRFNNKGWEYVFHPISDSCTSAYEDEVLEWPVKVDPKVMSIPSIELIAQNLKFLPPAVPADLVQRISQFNDDPSAWWVGQMLKYILKPQMATWKAMNDTIAKMEFKSPIVGVHIRRKDENGVRAVVRHLDEYMTHVADYYAQLELTRTVDERRVYLATDDANVLEDARRKYPQYTFLGDLTIAKTAADPHHRYTPLALTGLLVDLHMLAKCDYVVCTFSSLVSRVVYELAQTNRVDASESFDSLDDIYYFRKPHANYRMAVMTNTRGYQNDISFEVQDEIGSACNHWNGYGHGVNRKTQAYGLIPWYKTTNYVPLYTFPEYNQVPMNTDTQLKKSYYRPYIGNDVN